MAEQWLTRRDAAAACACHVDTLRRREKSLEVRRRTDGTVELSVASLVRAGLLAPLAGSASVQEAVGRSRAERDLVEARREIAALEVRVQERSDALRRAEGEITFLRGLLQRGAR